MEKEIMKEIETLKRQVAELQKAQAALLQDDFTGKQVYRREVQFLAEVKNAAGTVVIN